MASSGSASNLYNPLFILLFFMSYFISAVEASKEPPTLNNLPLRISLHLSGAPYSYYRNSHLEGLIPYTLETIAKIKEKPITLVSLPVGRESSYLNRGAIDLAVIIHPKNEPPSSNIMQCFQTGLMKSSLYLYTLAGATPKETDLLTIGAYRDATQPIDEGQTQLEGGGKVRYRLEGYSSHSAIFKSLASKRIDMAVSSPYAATFWGRELQIDLVSLKKSSDLIITLCYSNSPLHANRIATYQDFMTLSDKQQAILKNSLTEYLDQSGIQFDDYFSLSLPVKSIGPDPR